ncbi:MAG: energy transducer TonB [Nitrospiraceae bacterium]|nr:MAG: energy transducer TonB [Nitrospiraceae bacterium]
MKKTISISLLFHVVFFSTALLFSAGLFKGRGNSPDEKVFFVKLAVENGQIDSKEFILKRKKSAPKKDRLVAQMPPESVKQEAPLEKALESLKETAAESESPAQDTSDSAKTVEEALPDHALKNSDDQDEIVQASMVTSVSENKGHGNGPSSSGLSPSMIDLIGNAIEKAKSYPLLARKRGMEGTVYVSFRINASGEPDEIEIRKSSGHSILDSATVKVVQKAAPYPLIENRVEVPVAYRLSN